MNSLSKVVFCITWLLLTLAYLSAVAVGQQMEDVVYLKDGSIIRGYIIEQVPDDYIKLQTREGHIFVYRMQQVDRIIKEPRSNRIGSRTTGTKKPGLALGVSLGGGILVDGAGQFYNGEIGKGFGFVTWSIVSQALYLAGNNDNRTYGYDYDDDDFLKLFGAMSRIACYTVAAVDAYTSAKRKNEEITFIQESEEPFGTRRLMERADPIYPRFDLGLSRRGAVFVKYRLPF